MDDENLRVKDVFIENELKDAYLSYAMSVIIGRALPDVRDGLKPVHRRIIYAMKELGNFSNRPHKKSARIVGEVIGKYHPHGDTSVYDAMVRLAQYWSMRYLLVNGQGNFGSIDGDNPAAMRYCVTGNTLILTKNGLVPIKSLSNKEESNINETILSIDNEKNKAIKFFNSGEHPTIKIETQQGYEIEGSYNHPVYCFSYENNKPEFKWKFLEHISENDYVVLNRNSMFPNKNLKLNNFFPNKSKKSKNITLPKEMNEDLAFLLGALVSEGSFHQHKIIFNNSDLEFYKKVKNCIIKLFPETTIYERKIKGNCMELDLYHKQIVDFLINIGFSECKSDKKHVPFSILKSTKKIQKIFLQALFEGDGSASHLIDKRHNGQSLQLTYESKSNRLIKELKIVLLNFGISTLNPVKDKRNNCYKLIINSISNIQSFQKEINFFSQKKIKVIENIKKMNTKRMSRLDMIPHVTSYLKEKYQIQNKILLQTNISQKTDTETKIRTSIRSSSQFIGRYNIDRYNNLSKRIDKLKSIIDSKDYELLDNILKNKYLFNKVSKITKSKTKKNVYSVKVDSNCHSFVANGFINHNTEAKMSKITEKFLQDIDKETVSWRKNFDDTLDEPEVLPTLIPNLMVNGSSGIAVGMATNIPPHNLGEVIDATIEVIDNPNQSVEELVRKNIVKAPDFPTSALILKGEGIQNLYLKGEGSIGMKAICSIEEIKKNKEAIVVEEIPYQVNKVNLINQMVELVKQQRVKDITDIRDESNKKGIRIVIEIRKDVDPNIVLNQLYKFTSLKLNFSAKMLAIVNGVPKILNLKEYLNNFIAFRKEIIINRTKFDLKKSEERLHILEGLKKALDNIDAVIKLIKESDSTPQAKENLVAKFEFSEIQAQAILDMRLQKLTGLEMEKIRDEYNEILKLIKRLKFILENDSEQYKIIKQECLEIKEKFADERKSKIVTDEGNVNIEDLIQDEDFVVMITRNDYIKKVPLDSYRSQKRGGKGIKAHFKGEDIIKNLFVANSKDTLLIFTSDGNINWMKAYEVPTIAIQNKGRPIVNYIDLRGKKITNIINVSNLNEGYLIFLTKKGIIKKTEMKNFAKPRAGGIKAINLDEGDTVLSVIYNKTAGADILCENNKGYAIRFSQDNLSILGRTARGVKAQNLKSNEEVVGIELALPGKTMLTITESGYGKRTLLSEYPTIKRAGRGVIDIKTDSRNGNVITMKAVGENDEVLIVTEKGKIIRTPISDVRIIGRNTKGVKILNLESDDRVERVERIATDEEVEE